MRSGSILCVEDEEDVLLMEEKMLNRLGYEVIASSNALEALEIFTRHTDRIRLVIADILMPGITGNALAKRIKDISPCTPVILTTGNVHLITTDMTRELMEMGVTCILAKPFRKSALDEAVVEALGSCLYRAGREVTI